MGRRGCALLVVVAFQFAIALFPFVFDPPGQVDNDVRYLADGTLSTDMRNRAETTTPPAWLPEVIADDRLVVDLVVRAGPQHLLASGTVLAVSTEVGPINLAVEQHGDDLFVKTRRSGSPSGYPPWVVHDVFADGQWHQVRLELTGTAFVVAVDDRVELEGTLAASPFSTWDPSARVSVGDEPGGGRGWRGELRRAEVHSTSRTIDYVRPGELDVPPSFYHHTDRRWQPVRWPNRDDLIGGILHAVLFLPVGAAMRAQRWRHGSVVGGAALIALTVQVAKTLFAVRHPALVDVPWMATGALLGSLLVAGRARLLRARVDAARADRMNVMRPARGRPL